MEIKYVFRQPKKQITFHRISLPHSTWEIKQNFSLIIPYLLNYIFLIENQPYIAKDCSKRGRISLYLNIFLLLLIPTTFLLSLINRDTAMSNWIREKGHSFLGKICSTSSAKVDGRMVIALLWSQLTSRANH